MPLQPTDKLLGPPRMTQADIDSLISHLDQPDDKDRAFITQVVKDAKIVGIDDANALAQHIWETDDQRAPRWNNDLNPGGVGIPSNSTVQPFKIANVQEASAIFVNAVYAMVTGHAHPDLPIPANAQDWWEKVWLAKVTSPRFPNVETRNDLNIRYQDFGDSQATWAWDQNYVTGTTGRFNGYVPGLKDQSTGGGAPVAEKPTIILTAGHRSDNDAGNPDEKGRTQYLAQSYQAAFQAAGFVVHYVQNEDGDGRPDITTGGLDTVGQKTAAIMRNIPGPMVDLDLHYEGADARGVFAIVPDETGLVTAIAGGAPGDDTWANNPLDVELARAISQAISKATGLPLRATTEAGVMSERATGVGIQGYRLATMAYSVPFRDRAVRLVVEHGSLPTSDRDIILTPTFTEKCAKAAVSAVNTVYKLGSTPTPKPPPSQYATPGWVPPQDGKDHKDKNGHLWRAIRRVVHVKPGTKFYSQASTTSKETRSPAGPNGMYVTTGWQVNSWYVTPVGSRFKRSDSDLMVTFKDVEV